MKKTVAAICVFMLLILGACSNGGNTKQDTTKTEANTSEITAGKETETPENTDGGEVEFFKIGLADLPKTMDPVQGVGNTTLRVHANVFETLLVSDPLDNFKLKPWLAESYERVDGKTIEFKLRPGVKFHDGTDLTSEDVAFSFGRLKDETIPNVQDAANLLRTIDHVEIIDDLTFRVVASIDDPILEQRVACPMGAGIIPKAYFEKTGIDEFASNPIGTGPYKVTQYSPQRIDLERFEDYWGEKAIAAKVQYLEYPEAAARITALINNELDLIAQVPADQVALLESEKSVIVKSKPITNMHLAVLNTNDPVLSDKKLRQAMSLAVDKQLLVDTLWSGKAEVPKGHQFHEYGDLYVEDYPAYEFNLEKAKELVAESNYKGEELTYSVVPNYYTFGAEQAEALVDMWHKIGVNVKVNFSDKKDEAQISQWSNTMRFPDPAGGIWLQWGADSGRREKTWSSMPDSYVELGQKMVAEADLAKRKELMVELMKVWDDDVPAIPVYYPAENWAYNSKYEWEPYSNQVIDLRANNLGLK
ncbi:MAG: ABC transporter substrate-binding protein [Eubacteriales bacterium]|nr:ABC transporter substrate-binding protein [Eubacteriales bacterium]